VPAAATAGSARYDIWTAICIVTLLFMVGGIVLGVLEWRTNTAPLQQRSTPTEQPAKLPTVVKSEDSGTGAEGTSGAEAKPPVVEKPAGADVKAPDKAAPPAKAPDKAGETPAKGGADAPKPPAAGPGGP
jgi:hypothetical protein